MAMCADEAWRLISLGISALQYFPGSVLENLKCAPAGPGLGGMQSSRNISATNSR